jgi:hypothetical protein
LFWLEMADLKKWVQQEAESVCHIEASPRQAAGNVLPDGRASQHRKDDNFLDIRSLTPQQATGNALAYAVQLFNHLAI